MISVVAMHNIGNITKHSNYYEAESTWAHTNREREIIALMCLKVAVHWLQWVRKQHAVQLEDKTKHQKPATVFPLIEAQAFIFQRGVW